MWKNLNKNQNAVKILFKIYCFILGFNQIILGKLIIEEVLIMMFSRKRNRAMMKMAHLDSNDMKTVAKVVAAGFIAYQATKFVMKEIMD